VEGAGKTSAMTAIEQRLAEHGIDAVFTREPGGTELGEAIRELLLGPTDRQQSMSSETELLLVFAARAQHLAEVIRPALAAGQWVVCDRFSDATYAYQGFGRGLDREWIATLEQRINGTLQPDLTILLDVDVTAGRQRALSRGTPDRFEAEADAFFERVRTGYATRQRQAPERFSCIDASRTADAVMADVGDAIDALIAHD
jgi:dTMP kinase